MNKYSARKIRPASMAVGGKYVSAEILRDGTPVAFVTRGNGSSAIVKWYGGKDAGDNEAAWMEEAMRAEGYSNLSAYLDSVVNHTVLENVMRHKCRTCTCWKLKSQGDTQFKMMPVVFSKDIGDQLRASQGDELDFIWNERLSKEA